MTTPALTPTQQVWADPEHAEWAAFGARLGVLAGALTTRKDLAVTCKPDATQHVPSTPPACFAPWLAHISVDARVCLNPSVDDPAYLDPNDPRDERYMQRLLGVFAHETAHAEHTTHLTPEGLDRDVYAWMVQMEEPRIEGHLLRRHPHTRVWMRRSWNDLIRGMANDTTALSVESLASMAVLLLGRDHAGVVEANEVESIREAMAAAVGIDFVTGMDAILRRAVKVADADRDSLAQCARDVLALIAETKQELGMDDDDEAEQSQGGGSGGQGEQSQDGAGQSGDGGSKETDTAADEDESGQQGEQSGDGAGSPAQQAACGSYTPGTEPNADAGDEGAESEGSPAGQPDGVGQPGAIDLDPTALTDAAEQAEQATNAEAGHDADGNPVTDEQAHAQWVQQREQEIKDATEKAASANKAGSVFGPGGVSLGNQISVTHTEPSEQALTYVRDLTAALRKAQFRTRHRTRTLMGTPPGKMRTGEMMRRQAQVSLNRTVTATPFRRNVRRNSPRPPLLVGISGDVSASMQQWQDATGDLSWALARALTVGQVRGQVAAVAWNTGVTATVLPRTTPHLVPVARCADGTTRCAESIDVLSERLGLGRTPDAARVLIVTTDGGLEGRTIEPTRRRLKAASDAGVLVLWVTPYPNHTFDDIVVNIVVPHPDMMGATVGQALVEHLHNVGDEG